MVGTLADLTPAEVAAGGTLHGVASAAPVEAATVTVECTVEAVVLAAATLGGSGDD